MAAPFSAIMEKEDKARCSSNRLQYVAGVGLTLQDLPIACSIILIFAIQ